MRYFKIGMKNKPEDWRDSSFVVATSDPTLLAEIEAQLKLPIDERMMVTGPLEKGSGGYNKNGAHEFKWHYTENQWNFTEMAIELCDGRPYSDVDLQLDYWLNTVTRFCPWSSYVEEEIRQ